MAFRNGPYIGKRVIRLPSDGQVIWGQGARQLTYEPAAYENELAGAADVTRAAFRLGFHDVAAAVVNHLPVPINPYTRRHMHLAYEMGALRARECARRQKLLPS